MSEIVHPLSFEQSTLLPAPPGEVFPFLDDFEKLGAHMSGSSWMMAGSNMRYEFDSARGRGVGAHVTLQGSFLGIGLLIDEQVVECDPPFEKSWSTIGAQHMLIMTSYRMGFLIRPVRAGSELTIYIDYSIPPSGLGRWLGKLCAGWYARWCVRGMLNAASIHFGRAAAGEPAGPRDPVHDGIAPKV